MLKKFLFGFVILNKHTDAFYSGVCMWIWYRTGTLEIIKFVNFSRELCSSI